MSHLDGASVEPYLLEKSRVLAQGEGERNFHILYELVAGAIQDGALAKELKVRCGAVVLSVRLACGKLRASRYGQYRPAKGRSLVHTDWCCVEHKLHRKSSLALRLPRSSSSLI